MSETTENFNGLRCLMIDNFDSFTYNLVQYLQILCIDVTVVRSDCDIKNAWSKAQPDFAVISPGPSHPREAAGSLDLLAIAEQSRLAVLGVCLGHQCIGHYFGGQVKKASLPVHGKTAVIHHHSRELFAGLPNPLRVARYHSLVIANEKLPASLEVTSSTDDKIIMSIKHRQLPIAGVQFHPESIISEHGLELFANFVRTYVLNQAKDAGPRFT